MHNKDCSLDEDHLFFAHSRGAMISRRSQLCCAFKCAQCYSVVRRHANYGRQRNLKSLQSVQKHQVRDVSRLHTSHVNASALL